MSASCFLVVSFFNIEAASKRVFIDSSLSAVDSTIWIAASLHCFTLTFSGSLALVGLWNLTPFISFWISSLTKHRCRVFGLLLSFEMETKACSNCAMLSISPLSRAAWVRLKNSSLAAVSLLDLS